jgi:hypothetical protein
LIHDVGDGNHAAELHATERGSDNAPVKPEGKERAGTGKPHHGRSGEGEKVRGDVRATNKNGGGTAEAVYLYTLLEDGGIQEQCPPLGGAGHEESTE